MEANVNKADKSLKSFIESLMQSKDIAEHMKDFELTLEQVNAIFDFIKYFKEDIHIIVQSLQEESKEVLSANNMVLKAYLEELRSAKSFEEKQAWVEKIEQVRGDMNKNHSRNKLLLSVAAMALIGGVKFALSNSNKKNQLDSNIS